MKEPRIFFAELDEELVPVTVQELIGNNWVLLNNSSYFYHSEGVFLQKPVDSNTDTLAWVDEDGVFVADTNLTMLIEPPTKKEAQKVLKGFKRHIQDDAEAVLYGIVFCSYLPDPEKD